MSTKRKFSKYCHLCGPTDRIVFSFPKRNHERMKEWLEFCNISESEVLQVPFLCELHFDEKFVFKKPQRTYLHFNATPTKFIENSVSPSSEKPSKKKRVGYCYICGPTNSQLHQFPADEVRRNEWFQSLNVAVDSRKNLMLCSKHFPADSSFITPHGLTKLKHDAKPQRIINSPSSKSMNDDRDIKPNTCILNPVSLDKVSEALRELASTSKRHVLEPAEVLHVDCETILHSPTDNDTSGIFDVSNDGGTYSEKDTSTLNKTEIVFCEELTSESASRFLSEDNDTPKKPTANVSPKRNLRYIGDIDTPSLESPRSRRKCLSIIRTHKLVMARQVKNLKQENVRLKAKIRNLVSLLSDLKQKKMITEEAETTLLVKFSSILRSGS